MLIDDIECFDFCNNIRYNSSRFVSYPSPSIHMQMNFLDCLRTKSVNRNDRHHYLIRCLEDLDQQIKNLDQKMKENSQSSLTIFDLQKQRLKKEKELVAKKIKILKEQEDPDIIA